MRPIDHFYSAVQRLGVSVRPGDKPDETTVRLQDEFVSLVGPVIGPDAAGALFRRSLERCVRPDGGHSSLVSIGAVAAFFLGEYDDSMSLADEDWDDIKETLEESAEEMDMNTLTGLMDELLKKGLIK
jgi:hypothetical protein